MKKILLYFCFLIYGCSYGHYDYFRDCSKSSISKDEYTVEIDDNITNYTLYVNNKSKNDIEIDWNRTSFIRNGQTDGNFKYIDRNSPKKTTLITSGTSMKISIYPNNLTYFQSGQYGDWRNFNIPDGENGIYLVFKQGSKEYRERLLVTRTTKYIKDNY